MEPASHPLHVSHRTGAGELAGETPGAWVGTEDTKDPEPVHCRTARVAWEEPAWESIPTLLEDLVRDRKTKLTDFRSTNLLPQREFKQSLGSFKRFEKRSQKCVEGTPTLGS